MNSTTPCRLNGPTGLRRDERGDHERIDGQARRAGHQRRDHDRRHAVAQVRDRARRHDAGHRAGEARQQRDERATRQPDAAHQAVEQVGRARQVAAVLEREDEEEQDQDLRQEHEHAADACDDAVDEQAPERAVRQRLLQERAERTDGAVDELHRRGRPAEHGLEHEEQHEGQDRGPRDGVHHERIESRERLLAHGLDVADHAQDAPHLALRLLDLVERGLAPLHRRAPPRMRQGLELLDEVSHAAVLDGDGFDDRHAEFALEQRAVEPVAAIDGEVAHVQRNDHRHAEVAQLEHEAQVEPQVGRVHHADDELGRRLVREPSEQEIARDRLVERRRRQAVRARQVEHLVQALLGGPDELAFLAFDRDARVVGDALAAAREPVEERRLAAVRHADERETHGIDGGCVGHRVQDGSGSTMTAARLAAPQGKRGVAQANGHRVAAGPDLLDDLERFPRHESEFQQAAADGGLGLVAEALRIVTHVDDYTPGAFAQRGKTDGGHSAVGHAFEEGLQSVLNEIDSQHGKHGSRSAIAESTSCAGHCTLLYK